MKQLTPIIVWLFAIFILTGIVANLTEKPECPFEGAECPNAQLYLRDYQIEVYMDTVWVYDADRVVGKFINKGSKLDSIIIDDNL